MKNYNYIILLFIFFYSCQFNTPTEQKSNQSSDIEQGMAAMTSEVQQGVAKEIQHTSNYTYILINNGVADFWIAVSRMEAKVGTKYYFIENMKMENFHSKELNKSFESILFVQKISTTPDSFDQKQNEQNAPKPEIIKHDIKVESIKGGITIAELYLNKNKYEGKLVTIKGTVTKFNEQIMGKNWIHLQDGSENEGHFDLTITTSEKASVGETFIFTGKISLNKDFGAGYKYDVLMEDAVKK